jgi:hypothetical protein
MRYVAVWYADDEISREDMSTVGRAAIEQAIAEKEDVVRVEVKGVEITFRRMQFNLPVYVESNDPEDAEGFMEVLTQRARDVRPN